MKTPSTPYYGVSTNPTGVVTVLAAVLLTCNIRPCSVVAFVPGPWSNLFKLGRGGIGNGNLPPPPPRTPISWGSYYPDENEEDNYHGSREGTTFAATAASLLVAEMESCSQDGNQVILLQDEDDLNQEKEHEREVKECQGTYEEVDFNLKNSSHPESLPPSSIRGGSTAATATATAKSRTQTKNTNDILAGTKSSIQTTISYWSDAIQQLQQRIMDLLPNRNKKRENEIDLTKIPIQDVQAPTSDILPDIVVKRAAQRSGMLGSVMNADRVNECARQLKKWYIQRGYVLHAVTGATLHSENGTATLIVQEPILSSIPLDIRFAKEVVIDPETGETITRRKYRENLEKMKGRPLRRDEWMAVSDQLNTTLIESKGRTNPRTISKRLGLKPGHHFCWDGDRWQRIAQSGIFSKIWRTSPVQMADGTVQLQVLCQESPPRNLEYGISKSLYTGHWEGELDFKHGNILGGGESLGLIVRRGARDPEPSVTLRFSDDKFGMNGGYDAEIFSDYIAVDDQSKDVTSSDTPAMVEPDNPGANVDNLDGELEIDQLPAAPLANTPVIEEKDSLLCRKGLKFSLRGPIPSNIISRSSASASIERTSTRKGVHESMGSATLNLGPFVKDLALGARASVATSATSGVRIGEKRLLPYSSGSITSRQLFPLFTEVASSSGRQAKLALQHSVMTATAHLPRHEANAAGFAARVRGVSGSSVGPIDSSVIGSAEIRIPVTIPIQKEKIVQDGSIVFFGDWMFAHRQTGRDAGQGGFSKENVFGKSSIGVGLRKSVQGIPLKYDVSLTRDGKVGAFVSLGSDWEIY